KRLPVISDFLNGTHETIDKHNSHQEKKDLKSSSPSQNLPADDPLLKVENLSVYFPVKKNFFGKILKQFKAVDEVSFIVNKGETLGWDGESGCGKTTLGRSLIRLIPATSGAILFNGKNIANIAEDQFRKMRKDIQIIFQDPYGSLNPRLTIGQAINEPMK